MTELSEVDCNILDGVSATTLWTLHNRGTEAKRSDPVIRGPWAVTLFDTISYDYRKFGKPNQSHVLRALAFDAAAQNYLTERPKASVVALAEGLLMYLKPDDALGLIRDCAIRFPGGQMMFDSIPHWLSRRTLKGLTLSDRYTTPPMPFGLTAEEGLALADSISGVRAARDIPLAQGRGTFKLAAWPPLDRVGLLRRIRPSMTLLEFGS
jgi:O-methyltransferase involved in polyketide biosynthesis